MAIVLFPSCKPKKIITQPVVQAPIQEAAKPAPVAETDSDGDGIPDSKDNCQNKAGTSSNGGCPETVAAEPSFNYKIILFEFNSSVLKTASYSVLDEMLVGALLIPFAGTNLRAPVSNKISCSDASEEGGAAAEASCFISGLCLSTS